jgi:LydA holin phage, holin superfamily III
MKRRLVALLAMLHLLPAHAADRDPLSVPLREYIMWLGISVAAGFVSWLRRVRSGDAKPHDLLYLVGELACSVMAGMVTWALCEYINAPKMLTVAMVAINGHLGTRAIMLLERFGERQMAKQLGEPPADPSKGG